MTCQLEQKTTIFGEDAAPPPKLNERNPKMMASKSGISFSRGGGNLETTKYREFGSMNTFGSKLFSHFIISFNYPSTKAFKEKALQGISNIFHTPNKRVVDFFLRMSEYSSADTLIHNFQMKTSDFRMI